MKIQLRLNRPFYALAAFALTFASCSKEMDNATTDADSSATIAVLASETALMADVTTDAADSVYIVQSCARVEQKEIISESNLPAVATDYLTTNYSGYSFYKAFAIKSRELATTGYVMVIYYNDKPVCLKFDASGNFVKVLEQREKGDLQGRGWHRGGRFECRDGKKKDTISLTSLPSEVQIYLASSYAGDTLVKAFRNRDSSLVVVSKNNGLYATVFDVANVFIERIQLPAFHGNPQEVAQTALPAAALNYLDTSYPNYVFDKAFGVSGKGFIVLINANNTRYAVAFDASGNFVKSKTIY